MSDLDALVRTSIDVILQHQAPTGAYLAGPDFPSYRYSWFRDGAFIAEAMSRVGEPASADAFHDWCAGVLRDRSDHVASLVARAARGDRVDPDEHLHTRYTVDGTEADEEWWTFQLDGFGTWLWALDRHLIRRGRHPHDYTDVVDTTVRYLAAFWDHPC